MLCCVNKMVLVLYGRLGILVDFLSRSTILGFMSGTAIIISLQQLKGLLGMTHFTTHTDVVAVLKAVFSHTDEVRLRRIVFFVQIISTVQTVLLVPIR